MMKSKPTNLRFWQCTDEADIPDIISLAREAHDESRFSYIKFSDAKVRKITKSALQNNKQQAILMVAKGDRPIGFASCSIGEYHIGEGAFISTIHNMNVSQSFRSTLAGGRAALGLLKGIETWSKARGAIEVLFHVTSDVDLARSHKFSKRIGFKFVGGSYVKSM
jgi:hypothetical protein